MGKYPETETNAINLIGMGTSIKGDVESSGDIRIDGNLKGNLITKGKVVLGATGTVKGEIVCKNSDVEGKIDGKITANELLTLKSTSTINGDIIARQLAIEPGAKFTGNCNMSNSSPQTNVTQQATEEQKKPK
jgi:cytoskeletal protein CcmA (bactofilin family)